MRILVAPDSFGGTLTAVQAAEAVMQGWRRVAPADELDPAPVSDGGPGFLDVLHTSLGGELRRETVPGPLGADVTAAYLLHDGTAYVESAQAAGLHLVPKEQRDPLRATTVGVGVQLAAAVGAGARRIVVGLGGSATNDGGAGLLTGLGSALLRADGAALAPGGAALGALARAKPGAAADLASAAARGELELIAATDVDSPLLGPQGASSVFGPQKGATAKDVEQLDAALAHFADILDRDWPAAAGKRHAPGAGAAGGIGYALFALGARRESGIDLVLAAIGLANRVAIADLVITGEGSFDSQSLRGKAASGVARVATYAAVPCIVVAGQTSVGDRELRAAGFQAAYSVAESAGSVAAAMNQPAKELARLAQRLAETWSR
jgi:glycerate 2-kinase